MPASKKLDINLLKEGGVGSKPLGKFLRWSLTYGRYIIIGTQIVVLLAFFSRFVLDQQLSDLHTRIDEKINILEALAPIETNTRNIQNKIAVIKNLEDSRDIYSYITNTIAVEVPQNIIITQLLFNGNVLSIQGSSKNNAAFANLLSFLKENPSFSEIDISEVKYEDDGSLTFNIATNINPQKT
ncbi:PilN domain-containing protein [Candidatus Gottesmanbacteria bacterium]|nr:PilN domain-containing protein [Candidatus Gottesmanbacteria bacterium]